MGHGEKKCEPSATEAARTEIASFALEAWEGTRTHLMTVLWDCQNRTEPSASARPSHRPSVRPSLHRSISSSALVVHMCLARSFVGSGLSCRSRKGPGKKTVAMATGAGAGVPSPPPPLPSAEVFSSSSAVEAMVVGAKSQFLLRLRLRLLLAPSLSSPSSPSPLSFRADQSASCSRLSRAPMRGAGSRARLISRGRRALHRVVVVVVVRYGGGDDDVRHTPA